METNALVDDAVAAALSRSGTRSTQLSCACGGQRWIGVWLALRQYESLEPIEELGPWYRRWFG
jgi:hypothetical protein